MVINTELKSTVRYYAVEVLHDKRIYNCVVEVFRNSGKPHELGKIDIQTNCDKNIKSIIINQIKNYFV